jgi:predicted alpha/beta hydrolase family esterase
MTHFTIVPGLGNSGPAHWQSFWEQSLVGATRLQQRDWDRPLLGDWLAVLDHHLESCGTQTILIAHSLGCALVAHWAAARSDASRVAAAMLVGPADVDSPDHTPPEVRNFAPMPLARLRFPSVVAHSSNDTYVATERAAQFAAAWGSELVDVGPVGHINSDSQLGDWPAGRAVLARLVVRLG